jgi:hypothetical protein
MNEARRKRLFQIGLALFVFGNLLWAVIDVLDGSSIARALVNLSWHLLLGLGIGFYLWKSRSKKWGMVD